MGQISLLFTQTDSFSVHPHVRGANAKRGRKLRILCGSSPRAWGKYPDTGRNTRFVRFIPTCVGQIQVPVLGVIAMPGSSPRAWGKCLASVSFLQAGSGSSPRAWGKCVAIDCIVHCNRFIPTCVGQISCVFDLSDVVAVHPHVRGANVHPAAQVLR